ncbi:hypothetical protein [Amycolatopsis sp. 195334CR]|uniref:hypothetical protein n=1 Tax=Amycolatopsis sp. 195334CR TaxID=2814588 RepID=UPI001A8DA853|nr:hypothetical protein [Amycolatopsis sp. 195334CR]MBN6039502.1 hypothetical protein [Amycolatopsis sp. 195334CR]
MTSLPAARPASLTAAFLMAVLVPLAALGLTAAACHRTMSWLGEVADGTAMTVDGTPVTQAKRDWAAAVSPYLLAFFAGVLVTFALLTVLWVVLGVFLRKGSSGARTTLTVFAVLWLVTGALAAVGGSSALSSLDKYFAGIYTMHIPASLLPLGYAQATVVIVGMAAFVVVAHHPSASAYINAATFARRT